MRRHPPPPPRVVPQIKLSLHVIVRISVFFLNYAGLGVFQNIANDLYSRALYTPIVRP